MIGLVIPIAANFPFNIEVCDEHRDRDKRNKDQPGRAKNLLKQEIPQNSCSHWQKNAKDKLRWARADKTPAVPKVPRHSFIKTVVPHRASPCLCNASCS